MKQTKKRRGEKPFLPGALLVRNAFDLNFANRAIVRRRLARLLASYRQGWKWMGDYERRSHLCDLISLLRIWRPHQTSNLAFWMCKAMEEFHLLQRRIFGPRLRISQADAFGLAHHWFATSVCSIIKGW